MSEGPPSAVPERGGLSKRRFGPYAVTDEIGRGAMGVVYRAHDPTLDRSVAIKVLPSTSGDPTYAERLLREARAMGHIDHPHILGVHAAGREGDQLYVVMPLVTGESLGARLTREGRLSLAEALRITRETASALQAASAAGIVHRDIKPDNLLLDAQGHVKVADFGLCRDLNATRSLTMSSDYVGTPRYSAPEQWLNKPLDGRADIFSLGVCLYEMLTGRPAFDAESLATLMQQVLESDVPPITLERPDLPEEASALLRKMMAPDPDDRFRDAGALIDAIDAVQTQTERAARPSGSAPTSALQTGTPAPPDLTATVAQPGAKAARLPRPSTAALPREKDDAPAQHSPTLKQGTAIFVACALGVVLLAGPRLLSRETRRAEIPAPPATSAATAAATPAAALPLKVFVSDFRPTAGASTNRSVDWLRVAGPDLVMEALRNEKQWLSTIPREDVELTRRQRFSTVSPDDPVGLRDVVRAAGARLLLQVTYGPGSENGTLTLTGSLYDFDTQTQIETFSIESSIKPRALLQGLQKVTDWLAGALASDFHIASSHQSGHPMPLLAQSAPQKTESQGGGGAHAISPPPQSASRLSETLAAPGGKKATVRADDADKSTSPTDADLEALTLYNEGLEKMTHSDNPEMLKQAWKSFDGAAKRSPGFELARTKRVKVETMLASKHASSTPAAR
ncbi:MAG: serine/threonine protein kinase [Proteobacteria bacterium]|nr:serine/threonine protein kinase [Pseudomonadota bacterium]